jgi:hypothetical protein
MRLILRNGYPFPYPKGLSEQEQEAISHEAPEHEIGILGVRHFEWLHTVTVEFRSLHHYQMAQALTGWRDWDASRWILEVQTSGEDGYDHPAIIVRDKAYCGFILVEEPRP